MNKTVLKVVSVVWAISGIVILFSVFFSIGSYRGASTPQNTTSPISPVLGRSATPIPTSNATTDYTKASNWFVGGASSGDFSKSKVKYYTISIPKLKIENATVTIGGEDLSESLIQYPGTALPGKNGNAAIFGHSVLPIFYDPKRYISIFSTLPTLRYGDEINILYDGISFKYRVENLFEVYPTDIQVLQQDPSDSFLSLITCVPPGDPTKPKRLIVRARIVPQ